MKDLRQCTRCAGFFTDAGGDCVPHDCTGTLAIREFFSYEAAAFFASTDPDFVRPPGYNALGLVGEAGEVANEIKKSLRDDGGEVTKECKERIKLKLGDTLWYLTAIAREYGMSLAEIASANIVTLAVRRAERGIK